MQSKKSFDLRCQSDIEEGSKEFVQTLEPKNDKAVTVALSGDLGAGKTTFTKECARIIGVKENVASPTYVLMRIYDIDFKGFKKYIHIDAYRLKGKEELLNLGWDDLIKNPEHLIFIEWPEMVFGAIPNDAINLSFLHGDDENHRIFSRQI